MKINDVPFTVTDWSRVAPVEHPGLTGTSTWRTVEAGNVRARVVEYSPDFRLDHWCPRGHVMYVIDGELTVELKKGSRHRLTRGMSFQAGDDETDPHLMWTKTGARVFIVD